MALGIAMKERKKSTTRKQGTSCEVSVDVAYSDKRNRAFTIVCL